jgi:hypothetical protein
LLAAVAYALAGVYAAASTLWQPHGTIGLIPDYGATVRDVVRGSPAARAGIVPGDRIRYGATPFEDRRYVSVPDAGPPIGATVTVALTHAGRDRAARLTAVLERRTASQHMAMVFLCVAALIFIAVGATLIVLRPSLATWGFGLYCLLALGTPMFALPWPTAGDTLAATLVFDVVQNIGIVGLLLFVLEFPQPFRVAWRDRVRASLPVLFVVLSAMTLYPDVANELLGRPAALENSVLQIVFGVVYAGSMFILCDTYRRTAPAERERIRWVLIGFGFGLLGNYIGTTLLFSTLIVRAPPPGLSLALSALSVLLPLAVAHAVIRHRVLDIRIAIRRALVFAIFTTALAVVFALLDYVFGTILEDIGLSRLIAAAVSVAIAFTFKNLEERALATVEAAFFKELRAEKVEEREVLRLRAENARQAAEIGELRLRLGDPGP